MCETRQKKDCPGQPAEYKKSTDIIALILANVESRIPNPGVSKFVNFLWKRAYTIGYCITCMAIQTMLMLFATQKKRMRRMFTIGKVDANHFKISKKYHCFL